METELYPQGHPSGATYSTTGKITCRKFGKIAVLETIKAFEYNDKVQ
jgi:hypothetical protein